MMLGQIIEFFQLRPKSMMLMSLEQKIGKFVVLLLCCIILKRTNQGLTMTIFIRTLLTGTILLFGLATFVLSGTNESVEYKADFIVKLMDYVTWPDGAGSDRTGSVVIAVVGESPLTPRLEELAQKRSKEGKKVVVKTISLDDSLADCQILFMPSKDKGDLAKVLKGLQDAPVLTVSDAEYFARHGVMINFFEDNVGGKSKVKFEVNRTTIKMSGLKLSSRLLKLAKII